MKNVIDIPAARIELRKDGIMHVHIKVPMNFELEHAMQIAKASAILRKDKKDQEFPFLTTANELVIPSIEVREFVASEERASRVSADAFVISSLPQRIIANTYQTVNKPLRPTKVFECDQAALAWLQQFVKAN